MPTSRPTVIFADADALPLGALNAIAGEPASLVLCSSETRAEIEVRQRDFRIRHPFVCENGSAAVIPIGYFGFGVPHSRRIAGYEAVEFGRSYEDVARTLHRVAARLRIDIAAFGDMSVEEVARECGLSLLRARLAKLREYQEVFRVRDPEPRARTRLRQELRRARVRWVERGRYDHAGSTVSVTRGVGLLARLYRRVWPSVFIAGVGLEPANHSLHRFLDVALAFSRDRLELDVNARHTSAAIQRIADRLAQHSSFGLTTTPALPRSMPSRERRRIRR